MTADTLHDRTRKRSFRTGCSPDMTKLLQETIDAISPERSDAFYVMLYKRLSIHD